MAWQGKVGPQCLAGWMPVAARPATRACTSISSVLSVLIQSLLWIVADPLCQWIGVLGTQVGYELYELGPPLGALILPFLRDWGPLSLAADGINQMNPWQVNSSAAWIRAS